jgi:hypothetical protein
MAEPWFDPNHFGAYYGAIVGGGGGALIGVMGGVLGYCASRGVARRWVLGGMYLVVALGLLQLGFGGYAWLQGQPYGIWYPPLMCGVVYAGVMGGLIPVIRARYREAEGRRLEAGALRAM